MEVVSARLSQCNQLPYMEVKIVVHCKDSAKSCSVYEQAGYMHVESFVVYIVGNLNGTRCRDGVKVLWCHSHLVWLVFF